MKKFFFPMFVFWLITGCGQPVKPNFDAATWKAPYTLPVEGWAIERFPIPIEFAPSIPYSGVEDIRFTTGWGDAKTEEYWCYAFLWYLDGKVTATPAIIEKNLEIYYNGLVGRNIDKRKIPADRLFPVKASIQQAPTADGDEHTFSGTVKMLDYMAQEPILLNARIHVKNCPGQDKTFIFYEMSPRPATDKIWSRYDQLRAGFNCVATGK